MSFANIIGQDIAVKSLKNIISQHQARGAYLFLGPDGTGKRTTALEFAKTLNCENITLDACDRCIPCNKINSMNHPDVFMVFPENRFGSIKIGKIREVIYQSSLKPYEGKKRIFVINDAESMTEEAQNAFLKLLEEPPENHIFILTASNIAGLFSTVVSRCKILKFYLLGSNQIQEFLILAGIDQEKATLFSHMAMGSLGRAMDYKEKDIIAQRDRMVNDFFLRRSVLLREDVLNENVDKDPEESLYLLLCWYRDLLISKFMQDQNKLLNIDRSREIFSYADRFSQSKLQRDLLSIMNTIDYIRRSINPKIALFNMAVELKRG
jgi:DNA polymerase-3 subunit delta'